MCGGLGISVSGCGFLAEAAAEFIGRPGGGELGPRAVEIWRRTAPPPASNATRCFMQGDRLIIRDLPSSGVQLHLHTDQSGNYMNAAHLKTYAGEIVKTLTPYEAAMADALADSTGLRRIDRR